MTAVVFNDNATGTAVGAASTQADLIIAVVNSLGGTVVVKAYGGAVLRQTLTLSGVWCNVATTIRRLAVGSRTAATYASAGPVDSLVFCTSGGTPIFTLPAGSFTVADAKLNCPLNLDGLVIQADSTKPIVTSATWDGTVTVSNTLSVWTDSGTVTNAPVQILRSFPKTGTGSIPSTQVPQPYLAGAALSSWQCDVKKAHSNGNRRDVVISMILPTVTTTPQQITFVAATNTPGNTAATLASLLGAGNDFNAQIRVAVSGTPVSGSPISARTIASGLSDATLASNTSSNSTNHRYWTQGPVCTTYIFEDNTGKSLDVGTDANKALRPSFIVKYWPTLNKVQVRFEIGAVDTQKLKEETVDVSFWTANTTPVKQFEALAKVLPVRAPLTREYWIGTAPTAFNMDPNLAYLAATRDLPNMDPAATLTSGILSDYTSTWPSVSKAAGAAGYWTKFTGGTGASQALYLMPLWEARLLYSGAAVLWDIAKVNCDLFSSFQLFLVEGDATRTINGVNGQGRIVSKAAGGRPNYNIVGASTGSDGLTYIGTPTENYDGWIPDVPHIPEPFYVMYLLTGDYFYYKRMMQLASWGSFRRNPGLGYNSVANGVAATDLIPTTEQERGLAWSIRNVARAWRIAVDSDAPMQYLWSKGMSDVTQFLHGFYGIPGYEGTAIRDGWATNRAAAWQLAVVSPNALCWHESNAAYTSSNFNYPPVGYAANGGAAPWQGGYLLAAVCHAVEMGYTGMSALAQFLSKFLVQLMTHPLYWTHTFDDAFPTQDSSGFYQSANDLCKTMSSATGNLSMYIDANGFVAYGTPNTASANMDHYGISITGALAMAYWHELGTLSYNKVKTYYDLAKAANRVGYDQRWAILPRSTP